MKEELTGSYDVRQDERGESQGDVTETSKLMDERGEEQPHSYRGEDGGAGEERKHE